MISPAFAELIMRRSLAMGYRGINVKKKSLLEIVYSSGDAEREFSEFVLIRRLYLHMCSIPLPLTAAKVISDAPLSKLASYIHVLAETRTE
jgi:hypothetical protein